NNNWEFSRLCSELFLDLLDCREVIDIPISKELGITEQTVRFYGTKTSRNRYPISTILITCLHF
ncbi:hypothetical protein, partial [Streptococcus pneumoniae]|uniref:hypothetical protein n=1 Tax=Streptococcus pneumoniae TaxID=1313 RepID=UPI001E2D2804